jgi:REP element-mobilizing transposase RayT
LAVDRSAKRAPARAPPIQPAESWPALTRCQPTPTVSLGAIFHALARQKECQIVEGYVLPDHIHMCIAIPPKHAVAHVIGFLKGKSAIAIARQCGGKERNFTGEHFWARSYAVSTVGFELEQVRTYMKPGRKSVGGRRECLLFAQWVDAKPTLVPRRIAQDS